MQNNSYIGEELQPDYIPTSDEKTLAILSHILTFVAPILAPLIIYLLKKDESKYVAYHAKESLNFQIALMIAVLVLLISIIGILLIWIVAIAAFVLVIIATIRASEGVLYKYPFTLRLIK
ncbi:MAG: putative transrane protein [Segetibacter sp.]|nr:putative transrane protein [Segetibacter sp.]